MNHNKLSAILKKEFPTLKKLFKETVYCFDPEYQEVTFDHISGIFKQAFDIVKIDYVPFLNDCENHATGVMWHAQRLHRLNGGAMPLPLGMFSGRNPDGLPHAFNIFVADGKVFIGDYGRIYSDKNYQPHIGFFV